MSFLFQHELHKQLKRAPVIHSLGIDISPRAIKLARDNRRLVDAECSSTAGDPTFDARGSTLSFVRADILNVMSPVQNARIPSAPPLREVLQRRDQTTWDILISNPPYILPSSFYSSTTARSVRNFEPRIALVPRAPTTKSQSKTSHLKLSAEDDIKQGDLFYPRLLSIARELRVKVALFEVGDMAQALRVARMTAFQVDDDVVRWSKVEVWCDGIADWGGDVVEEEVVMSSCAGATDGDERNTSMVTIRRRKDIATPARAVFCYTKEAEAWVG